MIKHRQRLSSNVIEAVVLSFFLLSAAATTIIIVRDNSNNIAQAHAENKMTMPFYISTSYIDDNSVLNQESTSITNNSNNSNGNNTNNSNDIINVQQGLNYGNNTTNGSSYLTYEDQADGISLIYPSNWQKIEYPSGAMNYGQGHRIIASFLAPLGPSDQWRTSINVQVSKTADLKNIIPQNANTTMINLSGHRAFKLEYTNTERMYLNRDLTNLTSIKLKVMQVWTAIGDNTYVLTYNAEASKYQQHLPIIQKMLSSFRVS
jgi:hypothetical protein